MRAGGISETKGQARSSDGRLVTIYVALRPLFCAACAGLIKEGELFTRAKMEGLSIAPRCQKCVPFEETKPSVVTDSPLLKTLFAPSATSKSRAQPAAPAEQARIRSEVEKRLGHALKRTRRGKS